jgi:hypothetical protein
VELRAAAASDDAQALRAFGLVVALALVACGSSAPRSSSDSNVIPPDLVPASFASASVTVTPTGGAPVVVAPDVVAKVVPFLVRRVFDAPEALFEYGLDAPSATVALTKDGTTITLTIGAPVFDKSAYYVQRAGDGRVWLVLADSIAPLLTA